MQERKAGWRVRDVEKGRLGARIQRRGGQGVLGAEKGRLGALI